MVRFHKKGIDTRAINILIAVLIIAMMIGGLLVWLRMKTSDSQSFKVKAGASDLRFDNLFAEFAQTHPDFFMTSKVENTFGGSELSRELEKWLKGKGSELNDKFLSSASVYNCWLEGFDIKCSITFRDYAVVWPSGTSYKKTFIMPAENGTRRVNIDAIILQ